MAAEMRFNRGEVICRKGQMENWMYEIMEGVTAVYVNYGKEGEKKLTELGKGAFIGELGLLRSIPRSATVVAEQDGTVLRKIAEADYAEYFGLTPQGKALMFQMSDRLVDITENYSEACRTISELSEIQPVRAAATEHESLWGRIQRFADEYYLYFRSLHGQPAF